MKMGTEELKANLDERRQGNEQSKTGRINMMRGFCVEPVHHKIIVGMPWATQWNAQMRSPDDAIWVFAPGGGESLRLSELSTASASSMIREAATVPQGERSVGTLMQCRGTEGNGGDTHAISLDSFAKAAVLRHSIQLTPDERQKWAKLKEEFSVVLNNKGLQAGRPPAWRLMDRIGLFPAQPQAYLLAASVRTS
ncbi:uncharacterized protein EMH_0015090 [Eimeria mitis]|uniref:Uncharacterized protein n=1 Tax=Eimeria mitis TaxID=44415 RepID=U6K8N4_9EIME|nr:uncharacterized protein EMH_0015090 [Eimeria mitis]CDJ33196.1 hypothetical protein EMH_0015090 [Eimeria mitis]